MSANGIRDVARLSSLAAAREEARRELHVIWRVAGGTSVLLVAVWQWRGAGALWPAWSTLGAAAVALLLIGLWAAHLRGARQLRGWISESPAEPRSIEGVAASRADRLAA